MIENYDYIKVPGLTEITIPVVKRKGELLDEEGASRTPDWVVNIEGEGVTYSTLRYDLSNFTELFGWYAKSSHNLKKDSSNNFYSSGTLLHSDVFLVVQNGCHNAYVNTCLAEGRITNQISISRLIKLYAGFIPIQTLIFSTCQWCGIYSYLEYSILRFTACSRLNICSGLSQEGFLEGQNVCLVDYSDNSSIFADLAA